MQISDDGGGQTANKYSWHARAGNGSWMAGWVA
jgi:hypothetical protein